MEIQYTKILKKLILPLIIFSVLIASISIYSLFIFQYNHINNIADFSFEKTNKLFTQKFQSDIKEFETFIKLISKDKTAIELFLNKDSDGLYKYYINEYLELKEKFNVSHFYFHRTDKINFLRIHNLKKHSDKIERKTLNDSISKKGLGSGIEFGIFHNLTLRGVYPWFIDNKIIGYIELGKEIDYFTPELAKLEDSEVIFTIQKNIISSKDYKIWLEKSKNNINFKELSKYYIIDSSLKDISANLYQILNNFDDIRNLYISHNNSDYYVNSKPFNNIDGEEIGKIYVLTNLTKEFTFLKNLITKVSIIIFILIFILILYYFRLIKKEEVHINKKEKNVNNLAITDSLTSLYNRRYFDYYSNQIIQNPKKDTYLSLILTDIDNFKKYNDNYGHQKGDLVLKNVAKTMKKSLRRKDDKCFRIGGEEFAIILEDEDQSFAYSLCESIQTNLKKENIEHLSNEEYKRVTLSIGICTINSNDIIDISDIYQKADEALYRAKNGGRNCIYKYEN